MTFQVLACGLLLGCAHSEPVTPVVTVQVTNAEAPVTMLGAGDVLEIRIYNEPELSGIHQIGSDGSVRLPLLGPIILQGLSPEDATEKITAGYNSEFLQNAQVSVFVKEFNSRKVYVLGQVKNPGPYPFDDKMTIIAAIAKAGGTTRLADPNRTVVTRDQEGNQTRLNAMVGDIGKGEAPDLSLMPGDIVFVPESLF